MRLFVTEFIKMVISDTYQHRTQAGNAMLIVALYYLNIKDLTSNDSGNVK